MNTQKVAISMPEDLVKDIDLISKTKGLSRSRYIASALVAKVSDEKRKLLKQAYDRVFSDEKMQEEQIDAAKWFEGAGSEIGQEW
jgi:metal-responsive CopG/Arc/MetJ family transcriptional regulator